MVFVIGSLVKNTLVAKSGVNKLVSHATHKHYNGYSRATHVPVCGSTCLTQNRLTINPQMTTELMQGMQNMNHVLTAYSI